MKRSSDRPLGVTRRHVLEVGTVAGALSLVGDPRLAQADTLSDAQAPPNLVTVAFQINGRAHTLTLDPRTTLLDALREHLGFTGTKKGCDQGQCGACTVIVNGQRINSCLSLAVMHAGDEVTTIEGLANDDGLHPFRWRKRAAKYNRGRKHRARGRIGDRSILRDPRSFCVIASLAI